VHFNIGVIRERRKSSDKSRQLHAIVGGLRVVSVFLADDLTFHNIDIAPPTWARVWLTAAVGKDPRVRTL
jgi:hypothetical protein